MKPTQFGPLEGAYLNHNVSETGSAPVLRSKKLGGRVKR
jgi:hypothetical protein